MNQEIINSFQESWYSFIDRIPGYLMAILLLAIGLFLSGKAADFVRDKIRNKSRDPLITKFLVQVIRIIFTIILFIFALRIAGLNDLATGIFTAAGASAVILGFAFKDIGENFISGVILTFNRPFNMNDIVKIDDVFGRIHSMEFRYTMIRTFDGKNVYIPNSDVIKKPVINFTENGTFRMEFVIGIGYNDDIDKAKQMIMEILNNHNGIIQEQTMENYILTDELTENGVNLKVYFWVYAKDYRRDALMMRGDIMEKIKIQFQKNNFKIQPSVQEISFSNPKETFKVWKNLNEEF